MAPYSIACCHDRLGAYQGREDAYWIRTVSGRPFHQLWMGDDLQRGASDEAITDRHKLRPLVEPNDEIDNVNAEESKFFKDYAS